MKKSCQLSNLELEFLFDTSRSELQLFVDRAIEIPISYNSDTICWAQI